VSDERDAMSQPVGTSTTTITAAGGKPRSVGRFALRAAVQVAGFLLSLGLLYWCVRQAFGNPAVADKLPKLLETPWWLIAAMLLCSVVTTIISGLVFWRVLVPIRRLSLVNTVAVNGVSTVLGYLPFKLSLIFRVLYHRRVDKVELAVMGGWFAAVAAIIIIAVSAPGFASGLRPQLDGWWWVIVAAGLIGGVVATLIAARLMVRFRGRAIAWLAGNSAAPKPGMIAAIARSDTATKLSDAVVMLADWRVLTVAMGLRVLDLGVQALRFYFASEAAHLAGIIDAAMPVEQCIVAGGLYFTLQAIAPTGVTGVREGGTVGLLKLLPGFMADGSFAAVVLVVSATEAIANVAWGGVCGAWLWWVNGRGRG